VTEAATAEQYCSGCGKARDPGSAYCSGCGRRFDPPPSPVAAKPSTTGGNGVLLITIGVVIIAIVGAIWFLNTSPSIAFSPNTIRCDGTQRVMTMRIPTDIATITVEMRRDSANGALVESDSQPVSAFSSYETSPGNYRIETTTYDAWECRQSPGRYTMVMRDAATGRVLASGDFSIDD
jgi:hypothetical protein